MVTLVILLASKRENSSQYTITILMLHVPLESNYWLSYCCWRSFALGELCLLGYQMMTLPYRKQSYSSAISTLVKNRTQTAVTNMMKQRMLQKTKIFKTWRFVCNNIHLHNWRLKRLHSNFKHLERDWNLIKRGKKNYFELSGRFQFHSPQYICNNEVTVLPRWL